MKGENKMKKTMLLFGTVISISILLYATSLAQWQLVSTIPAAPVLNGISVADPNTVWICGGMNTPLVFRSTNGGVNFTAMPTTGISIDLFCICAKDANECYAGDGGTAGGAGGNAKVYKTTNAGSLWTTILSTGGSLGFINGIQFSRSNPQVGVAESDPPASNGGPYWWALTTNDGTSWLKNEVGALGSSYASALNTVVLIDPFWFGVGSSNNVTPSAPNKIIWTNGSFNNSSLPLMPQSITQSYVNSFTMNTDKLHGAACITNNSAPDIAVTTDGCSTWAIKNMGGTITGNFICKWVPGTNVIYVLAATGTAGRRSIDGGNTWTTMTTAGLNNFVQMDLVYSGTTVYAYAFALSGQVIKLIESPVGIQPIAGNTPTQYSLGQNYPNPFNPTTKIDFAIPKSSIVTVKIYDILGHEIKTLVNEYKTAGIYSIEFDASSLSSGVYFYTIHAGDFTASKKMTVIK
jgi:hypothetical protein